MSRQIIFTIPGRPQGKAVVRMQGKKGFPAASWVSYKAQIQFAWAEQAPQDWKPWPGAVWLGFCGYFSVPSSWPKWRKEEQRYHLGKPDTDNIIKAIGDALTGLAWIDDKQIQLRECWKAYTFEQESLEVKIEFEPDAEMKRKGDRDAREN